MKFALLFILLLLLLFIFIFIINNDKNNNNKLIFGFLITAILLILQILIQLPKKITFNAIPVLIVAVIIVVINSWIILNQILPEKSKIETMIKNSGNFYKILHKLYWITDFKEYLKESLFTIYVLLLQLFPNFADYYFPFSYKFTNIKNKYLMEILLICFELLPKFIILFACIHDIFIYNEFHYLYKCSWIILIPIIFNIIVVCLDHYGANAMIMLKKNMIINISDVTLLNHIVLHYKCDYQIINNPENYSREQIINLVFTFFQLQVCNAYFQTLKEKKFVKYLTNSLTLGYIITWGYLIIFTIIEFIN